jgi:hypothetical protein
LLRDIQEATGRALLVYFASFNDARAQISPGDDAYFAEMIRDEIVMGVCSELGPADPFVTISPNQSVPAQFLLGAGNVDPIFVQAAAYAVKQTAVLATNLLSTGMMKGRDPKDVDVVVKALSSRETYPSHGSVIDTDEATRLGLKVKKLPPDDELWKQLWLLRCMYEHDLAKIGGLKIFEGATISNVFKPAASKP